MNTIYQHLETPIECHCDPQLRHRRLQQAKEAALLQCKYQIWVLVRTYGTLAVVPSNGSETLCG